MVNNFSRFPIICLISFVLIGVSETRNIYGNGNDEQENPYEVIDKFDQNNDQLLYAINMIKRAPNGFIGMRGKKESNPLTDYYQNDLIWNDEPFDGLWRKQKSSIKKFSGYSGNKVNDIYFRDFVDDYIKKLQLEHLRDHLIREVIDRDRDLQMLFPNKGYYSDHGTDNNFDKRAPVGFIGMRGKRFSTQASSTNNEQFSNVDVSHEKQNAQTHMEFKRSPFLSFNSGYFGTRGKKQPSTNLRNKFIGVRGKKDFKSNNDDLSKEKVIPNDIINNSRSQEFHSKTADVYEADQTYATGFKSGSIEQQL